MKELTKVRLFRTLFYRIRMHSKIIIYHKGKIQIDKNGRLDGNGTILFNCSQYRDNFCKNGHLWIGKNATISFGNGIIRIYSGCKIDVHHGALLEIGEGTMINENSRIGAKSIIKIGNNCLFGDEVSIHDFDGHKIDGLEGIKPITIGNSVWIGEKTTILKGVTIGDNVIVGAGSVVTKDLESGYIYCGNPAKPIKKFDCWTI